MQMQNNAVCSDAICWKVKVPQTGALFDASFFCAYKIALPRSQVQLSRAIWYVPPQD